jgi:acyl-CoA synthetase (AMP-forming)/AMP-acid ligase II
MPNFAFQHLLRTRRPDDQYQLDTVRAWINCSEPCAAKTFDDFAEGFAKDGVTLERLQVCYAMAETVFAISQTHPGAPVARLSVDAAALHDQGMVIEAKLDGRTLLSNGPPLKGVDVFIVDENRRQVGCDRFGEIAVRSPFLFSGYWNRPAQTAARLDNGIFYTGDLGFIHNGEIYVQGRKDDQFTLNGRNFFAHQIEAVVNRIPGVKPGRTLAMPIQDAATGTNLFIMIVETELSSDTDRRDLRRRIMTDIFELVGITPREVWLAPPGTLLKSTSGKLNRAANRDRILNELKSAEAM